MANIIACETKLKSIKKLILHWKVQGFKPLPLKTNWTIIYAFKQRTFLFARGLGRERASIRARQIFAVHVLFSLPPYYLKAWHKLTFIKILVPFAGYCNCQNAPAGRATRRSHFRLKLAC